jgi:glycosyltransferase involved in cell wall biosynthesis
MAVSDKERLNWLIIEDGLKDCHGHFLDFVTSFVRGLRELGDRVTVLCSRAASDVVREQTAALPVMPDASWRTGSLRSPLNLSKNACWIGASLFALLRNNELIDRSDLVFLTATRLEHLLLWRIYTLLRGRRFRASLLLFFMATPIRRKAIGAGYEWEGLRGRLFGALIRSLGAGEGGLSIRFVTETEQLSGCLSALSGVPFEVIPEPTETAGSRAATEDGKDAATITIASFGPPREEKGSHLLIKAIADLVAAHQLPDTRFVVQWTADFVCENGEVATIPACLRAAKEFKAIGHYFAPGEYEALLDNVDALVLPYGPNYEVRGSRVMVDALVRGLPVAVTQGSSMQTQAERFGSAVLIDGWTESAIKAAIKNLADVVRQGSARDRSAVMSAREYFSVKNFRALALSSFAGAARS